MSVVANYAVRTGRELAATFIKGNPGNYNTIYVLANGITVEDRWLSGLRNFIEFNASGGSNNLELGFYAQRAGFALINGGTGADTITATAYTTGLTINGHGGADNLQTGSGSDTFLFSSAADVVAAANIDGNAGYNTLELTAEPGAALNLALVNLSDVQRLVLDLGCTGTHQVTLDTTMTNVLIGSSNNATLVTNTNGQSVNAAALGDGKYVALTDDGSITASVALTLGDLDAPSYDGALTVTATGGTNLIATGGGADFIIAGAGNDTILAGLGNDTVMAGADNDSITGGGGSDSLTGDSGADRFEFASTAVTRNSSFALANTSGVNLDRITDFSGSAGQHDQIKLGTGANAFGNVLTFNGLLATAAVTTVTLNNQATFEFNNAAFNLASTSTSAKVVDVTLTGTGLAANGVTHVMVLLDNNAAATITTGDTIINLTGISGGLAAGDFIFG